MKPDYHKCIELERQLALRNFSAELFLSANIILENKKKFPSFLAEEFIDCFGRALDIEMEGLVTGEVVS